MTINNVLPKTVAHLRTVHNEFGSKLRGINIAFEKPIQYEESYVLRMLLQ